MKLDLSPLESALGQLAEGLALYDSDIVRQYPVTRNHFRASAIQSFEFTHELSISMIKRYLKEVSANPSQVDRMPYLNLMRMAAQHGLLLSEPAVWVSIARLAALPAMLTTKSWPTEYFRAFRGFWMKPDIF